MPDFIFCSTSEGTLRATILTLPQVLPPAFTTPSPTPIVPDSIPEPTGENLRDHSSNDASLSGNEDDTDSQKYHKAQKQLKSVINISKEYLKIYLIATRFPKKSFSKNKGAPHKSVSNTREEESKTENQKFKEIRAEEQREKADRILAEKLQEQEREQFTIEERANDPS
ncbi:hypothetical protein Tco_1370125 [Tanacetum coccineum]